MRQRVHDVDQLEYDESSVAFEYCAISASGRRISRQHVDETTWSTYVGLRADQLWDSAAVRKERAALRPSAGSRCIKLNYGAIQQHRL